MSGPAPRHYAAVFVLCFSVLVLEIAFARVLSVAFFSHYAFVAVSLAMFGLGIGGLVVYLRPQRFPAARVDEQLIRYGAGLGLSTVVAVLVFLQLPPFDEFSLRGFVVLTVAYGTLAIPFYLGGTAISLLMTHCSAHIARVYFADLVGASLGCLGVVLAMQRVPAPLVPAFIAVLLCTGALLFAVRTRASGIAFPAAAAVVSIGLLAAGLTTSLFTMRNVKGRQVAADADEAWNAFSRLSVFTFRKTSSIEIVPLRDPAAYRDPPSTKMIDIDGAAFTPMMNFTGDLSRVQFLRDTVLYAAHWVRPNARVLIIGTGGGRDIVAALAAEQPRILGIELNPLMRELVDERFGDYSGHVYSRPGVQVVVDEGRSHLSGLDETFDVIQLSLIDTFALNAAGGFVFSENYLYTVEALREYHRHLSPDGVLSLTRYFVPGYPLEILRLAALVRAAWSAEGATDPARHVVILHQGLNATMLVKREPFTPEELRTLDVAADQKGIAVVSRAGTGGSDFYGISDMFTTPDLESHLRGLPYLLDPPTDDRPFFFNFLRRPLTRVPSESEDPFFFMRRWNEAHSLMYLLIAVVVSMAALFLVGPLLIWRREPVATLRRAFPMLGYFACLGYGFMMIEIPLLQRFILLLGHPTYALVVVLFSLLLFSGLGSLLSGRFAARAEKALRVVLTGVMALGVAYAYLLPTATHALLSAPLAIRIATTIALLAPMGLLFGMPYPLGITLLRRFGSGLVPWAWALNGAMGVVASVLAIFLGSRLGFTAALLTGLGAYALALVATLTMTESQAEAAGAARLPRQVA